MDGKVNGQTDVSTDGRAGRQTNGRRERWMEFRTGG